MLDDNAVKVIISLIGLATALGVAKIANRTAEKNPPPPPRASVAHVDTVEERITARLESVETILDDVLGRLAAKTDQLESMRSFAYRLRDAFLGYVADVSRKSDAGERPPELSEEQKAMLYEPIPNNDEPGMTETRRTRRALQEHTPLVTLDDNPPPASGRRRRH